MGEGEGVHAECLILNKIAEYSVDRHPQELKSQPLTEGVLGDDGLVAVEGLRLALGVDSSHAELVLVAGRQVLHLQRGLGAPAGRHPAA